jgi:hypothetical protein
MAVPKKKTASSSSKTRRNTYVKEQNKKILALADRAKRHEKGMAFVEAEKTLKRKENVTVVQA